MLDTERLVENVPLLDVCRSHQPWRPEILEAIQRVVDSGRFLYGPDVERLEACMAELCGVRHGVACASGSDALLLALMALQVEPGDEVILPSFTFFATAGAVWRLGAKPVFVDIDPATYNVCPRAVTAAITHRTKAIIPVHLFGQSADMTELCHVADRWGIPLIEDAAQAVGAQHRGKPVGGWGLAGCFSFYPTKNLGGFGDGGMLTTNSSELADRLRQLACHGMKPRYYHDVVGINSRLDSIQAAVLNVKLQVLPSTTAKRRNNAQRYQTMLGQLGLDEWVELPSESAGQLHVWNQYTVRVRDGRRDELKQHLAERGVGTEIYYPVPLHLQECFKSLGYRPGALPETERAADEVLSLPVFGELREDEQRTVVARTAEYFEKASRSRAA